METKAILRYARISPQKCRLVADTVRGVKVDRALNTLKFMPKKGADLVHKVLWSAVENAQLVKSGRGVVNPTVVRCAPRPSAPWHAAHADR